MAQTVNVIVAAEDRERLLAIASDRNRPLKHVQRARIISFRRSVCRSPKSLAEPESAALPFGAGSGATARKG